MAEFLKPKKSTFVTRPIGVVNVDTGAVEGYSIQADAMRKIANEYFADAEEQQTKEGVKIGRTLPMRDVNQKLFFQELPSGLSDVVRDAAEPVIRERYENNLQIDIYKKIQEIRSKSKDSNEFQNNVTTQMGAYSDEIRKLAGDDYANIVNVISSKMAAQNFTDMVTKEMADQKRIQSTESNEVLNIEIEDFSATNTNFINNAANAQETEKILKDYNNNIKQYLGKNDTNLTNGLSIDTYQATKLKIQGSLPRQLIRNFMFQKDYGNALQLIESLEYNKEIKLTDSEGKEIPLSEKDKTVLNYLKQNKNKPFVLNELDQIRQEKARKEHKIRADTYDKDQAIKKMIAENAGSPLAQAALNSFPDKMLNHYKNIITKLKNGVNVEEELATWEMNFANLSSDKGLTLKHNGKNVIVKTGTTTQQSLLVAIKSEGIIDSLKESGAFTTSNDFGSLINQIKNPNKNILNTNQKKALDSIKPLLEKGGLIQSTENYLVKLINNEIVSLNRISTEQNENEENKKVQIKIANGVPLDKKERIRLENLYNLPFNYFNSGTFAEKLANNDETAVKVDKLIKTGTIPIKLEQSFERVMAGNAETGEEINRLLGIYQRYSSLPTLGGNMLDRNNQLRNLPAETLNVFEVANNLIPLYKGTTVFFGETNANKEGQQIPVSSLQMFNKIRTVYQNNKLDESKTATITKNYLKDLFNKTGRNYTDTIDFLKSLDFDTNEAYELKGMVDLAAAMNLPQENLITLLELVQEDLYGDGQGFVIDKLSRGNNTNRSKYAFSKIFKSEDEIEFAINQIKEDIAKLPLGTHKDVGIGSKYEPKGRYVFNATLDKNLTPAARNQKIYPTKSAAQKKGHVNDVKVVLQPFRQGIDREVKYVAFVQKGQFYVLLRKPEGMEDAGGIFVYDSKQIKLDYARKLQTQAPDTRF